jgi:hypothetical protein
MKVLVAPLAIFGLAVLAAETASAASPAYCALYAREYANQMVEVGAPAGMTVNVQDQAYYRCLNQDDDPVLPTASAYFGTAIDDLVDPSAKSEAVPGDKTGTASPAASPPAVKRVVASSTPRSSSRRGGSPDAWTPEWQEWCTDHFPNSFNPETGMVKPYKTNKWRFCE